jgi:corrinoid protein of di/trimethylamine methyltransferase
VAEKSNLEVGNTVREELFKRIAEFIISGDEDAARASAKEAMEAGVPPLEAIKEGVSAGLTVVGEKFGTKEFFYPDLVISAEAATAAISIIHSFMKADEAPSIGTYVIGTVEGDLHDIGKNLVKTMLEASGFKVIDLGINVPTPKFIEAAKEFNADIVGSSATIGAGGVRLKQKEIEEALREAGIRDKMKTMVGGIITSEWWAGEIGADAWGEDCVDAAKKAEDLMKKLKEERKR